MDKEYTQCTFLLSVVRTHGLPSAPQALEGGGMCQTRFD